MARARNIKPSFFKNEDLAELAYEARLLFIGTWTLADREGRLEDRPKKIKMELFPGDSVDVDKLLQKLHDAGGFILRYEANGKRYIQILNFQKHQHPHFKEPVSTIPKPEALPSSDGGLNPSLGRDSKPVKPRAIPPSKGGRTGLIPDSLLLIPESSGKALASSANALSAGNPLNGNAVACIPLNDGTEYGITAEQVEEFAKLYPAVDVAQTLNEIRGWNLAKPSRRKTRRGVLSHVNTWLAKEQNRG